MAFPKPRSKSFLEGNPSANKRIPGLSTIKFGSGILTILFRSFILAALLEEGLKFIVMKRVVSRSHHFNEPFDGMLYYVAVAVGFAVYEDFTYILAGSATQLGETCSRPRR